MEVSVSPVRVLFGINLNGAIILHAAVFLFVYHSISYSLPVPVKDGAWWSRLLFASTPNTVFELGFTSMVFCRILNPNARRSTRFGFSLYPLVVATLQALFCIYSGAWVDMTVAQFGGRVLVSGLLLPLFCHQVQCQLLDDRWRVENTLATANFVAQIVPRMKTDNPGSELWHKLLEQRLTPRTVEILVYIFVLAYLAKVYTIAKHPCRKETERQFYLRVRPVGSPDLPGWDFCGVLQDDRGKRVDAIVREASVLSDSKRVFLIHPDSVLYMSSVLWLLHSSGLHKYNNCCSPVLTTVGYTCILLTAPRPELSCVEDAWSHVLLNAFVTGLLVVIGNVIGLDGAAWVAFIPLLDGFIAAWGRNIIADTVALRRARAASIDEVRIPATAREAITL